MNLLDPLEESGFLVITLRIVNRNMKTKNLAIIFILFLLIMSAGGLVIFLTKEKNQPVLSEQSGRIAEPAKPATDKPVQATAAELKIKNKKITKEPIKNSPLNSKPKETIQSEIAKGPAEEKIKAVMIINDNKYEAEIKAGSSVYDLMNLLKNQNKIDFSGKNYSGLGFFIEEINGLKNNLGRKNWVYYINDKPAPVGISNYLINNNDIIKWKYEKKSF